MKAAIGSVGIVLWLAGCQAFDRDRYQSLVNGQDVMDPIGTDVMDTDMFNSDVPGLGGGACLTRTIAADSGCASVVFPSVPPSVPAGPSNGRTYVLAVKSILLGPGTFGRWDLYGFDLDGVCTNPAEIPPKVSCSNRALVADGQQGRDNAFGNGIGVALFVADYYRDSTVTSSISSARITIGFKVTEWSGLDDRSVTVEVVTLVQGRSASGADGLAWDGRDVWNIERSYSQTRSGMPLSQTTTGGIACGWIVARFADITRVYLPHRSAIRRFTLRDLHLAGPVDLLRGGAADITAMSTVSDVLNDLDWMGLCANDPMSQSIRMDVMTGTTRALDVRNDLSFNPALPCEASTISARLELVPVTLGGVVDSPLLNYDPCPADAGR